MLQNKNINEINDYKLNNQYECLNFSQPLGEYKFLNKVNTKKMIFLKTCA